MDDADFSALRHCMELRDAHIIRAVQSSEAMEALLARFVEIAAPGKGAPLLMAALARLGTTACTWIDGELRVDISGDETQTKIAVSTSLGGGFREKPFRDTVLRVPFDEFARGVKRAPKLVAPLQIQESPKRIVLSATQEIRKTSLPPPMVQIDPESMMIVPAVPQMSVPLGLEDARAPEQRPAAPPPPKLVLRRRVPDRDPK